MATRASLTVVSGTTITSAWGNSVRDHSVPRTTSDDVASEGQLAVNTSSDRLVVHDGSGAHRLAHYAAAGRTGVSAATAAPVAIGAGLAAQISFGSLTDPDGYYTGWNGSAYVFTVPSGLGGVYAITCNVFSSSTLTSGGVSVGITSGGLTYAYSTTASTNWGAAAIPSLPIASGGTFSVAVENKHSSSSNFEVTLYAYRTFA